MYDINNYQTDLLIGQGNDEAARQARERADLFERNSMDYLHRLYPEYLNLDERESFEIYWKQKKESQKDIPIEISGTAKFCIILVILVGIALIICFFKEILYLIGMVIIILMVLSAL